MGGTWGAVAGHATCCASSPGAPSKGGSALERFTKEASDVVHSSRRLAAVLAIRPYASVASGGSEGAAGTAPGETSRTEMASAKMPCR